MGATASVQSAPSDGFTSAAPASEGSAIPSHFVAECVSRAATLQVLPPVARKQLLGDLDALFRKACSSSGDGEAARHYEHFAHMQQELPLGAIHETDNGLRGIVRYVGPPLGNLSETHGANQGFCLLKLDGPKGNCDGTVGGVTIARLEKNHGLWVQREHVNNEVASLVADVAVKGSVAELRQRSATKVQSSVRGRLTRQATARKARVDAQTKDFNDVDKWAVSTPSSKRETFKTLVAHLIQPFQDDEEKKARSIFRWCAENIEYDMSRYTSGGVTSSNQSPDAVLKTGLAVCSGYAGLFKALADEAGIECVEISGYSKAASYKPGTHWKELKQNHAWNCVKVAGKWILCDACWAAGASNSDHSWKRNFENFWWNTDPEKFLYQHLPDASQAQYQFVKEPKTLEHWAADAWCKSAFFTNGLDLVSHKSVSIDFNDPSGLLDIVFSCPAKTSCIARVEHISRGGKRKTIKDASFVQVDANDMQKVHLYSRFPSEGRYRLLLFCKPATDSGSYDWALTYDVNVGNEGAAAGRAPFFPCKYKKCSSTGAVIVSPMSGVLEKGSEHVFEIYFPRGDDLTLKISVDGDWSESFSSDGKNRHRLSFKVPNKSGANVGVYCTTNGTNYSGLAEWKISK